MIPAALAQLHAEARDDAAPAPRPALPMHPAPFAGCACVVSSRHGARLHKLAPVGNLTRCGRDGAVLVIALLDRADQDWIEWCRTCYPPHTR
jgi:hypothetical protein